MLDGDFSGFDLPADIYADGIGAVENLGHNFRSVFFVWRRQSGVLIMVPVLCLIRPRESLTDGGVRRRLLTQGTPGKEKSSVLHS